MERTSLPVINSTFSAEHLGIWIAEKFGVSNVSCRLLKTNMNHSYLVTTNKDQYILRVYNHRYRKIDDVAEEVKLLGSLKETMSVSYPIAGNDGVIHEISAPEGIRYAVLFSYAKGKKVRYTTVDNNFIIGQEAGRLHAFTCGKTIGRMDYSVETMINWAHGQLAKYISSDLEEMKFIKASAVAVTDAFNRTSLRKGIVHLDIWYDNMSIQETGAVTLFDFDNCGNGSLALDIGYYCMQLFFVEADKAEYERKKAAFIDGYRSVISVPDEELALIPYAGYVVWIYYLGLQAQRFDYFGNLFLSENYLRMMVERVKGWLGYCNARIN